MTLLALWLGMLGLADLVRWEATARARRQVLAAAVATGTAVLLGALGDLGAGRTALVALGLGALTAAWLAASALALRRRVPVGVPLVLLAVGVLGLLAASPETPQLAGSLQHWYDRLPVPAAAGFGFDRFAVAAGALAFLQVSANVVVRLVLDGAGSPAEQGEGTLKGGRVLGPMERTFIFALGVAGELTAASVIVAAKGLLRFPEIQSSARAGSARRVDALTEYFLVGSLTSWLLALLPLPLT